MLFLPTSSARQPSSSALLPIEVNDTSVLRITATNKDLAEQSSTTPLHPMPVI